MHYVQYESPKQVNKDENVHRFALLEREKESEKIEGQKDRQRERERKRETEGERDRGRKRQRERKKQIERERGMIERDRHREREREREKHVVEITVFCQGSRECIKDGRTNQQGTFGLPIGITPKSLVYIELLFK